MSKNFYKYGSDPEKWDMFLKSLRDSPSIDDLLDETIDINVTILQLTEAKENIGRMIERRLVGEEYKEYEYILKDIDFIEECTSVLSRMEMLYRDIEIEAKSIDARLGIMKSEYESYPLGSQMRSAYETVKDRLSKYLFEQ